MKTWHDLSTTALLGTARAPLPPLGSGSTSVPALLGQLDGAPPERRLLAAAAVVHTWQQAGIQPPAAHTPRMPLAPIDERPACPPPAARLLGEVLATNNRPLFREWLELLARTGAKLPYRWLPELLDIACSDSELQPLMWPLLGTRACWLAAQRPEWRALNVPTDPQQMDERWQTGDMPSRLALLQHLRLTDPGHARRLLAGVWSQESAADRLKLAEMIAVGLSAADEPFLESLADDRSKRVVAVAADLLARLPGSRLVGRMVERLRPLLHLESGFLRSPWLAVLLPEECTPDLARDGVGEEPPPGIGTRAWWLLQMLSAAPPAHWSQKWRKSPTELIALAAKTEHEGVLLEAWAHAAARYGDPDWAEALLHRWYEKPWSALLSGEMLYLERDLEALAQSVSQERLEGWLTSLLKVHESLFDRESLLTLLVHHRRPWGVDLTHALVAAVRAQGAQTGSAGWQWANALPDLALYATPSAASEIGQGWAKEGHWRKSANQFLTTLHLRARMRDAFLLH